MTRITALATLLLSVNALANNNTREWKFDVFLDDKPIGYHKFEVDDRGSRTVLQTEAAFDVKFLFVTAFSYQHQNTEIWSDGCLDAISATTNNNGERLTVSGEEAEQQFEVSGKQGEIALDGCVRSFAYWNPDILQADRLLNSQTGEYEPVNITLDGEEVINVGGRELVADRYRVSVRRGDIYLWYTQQDKTWVALDAPAKGDRRIRYRAKQVPDLASERQMMAGTDS